jgi:serine/threonine protein phosphatase 1
VAAWFLEKTDSVAFPPLTRLWRKSDPPAPTSGGRLVYAVGDVHGRADLLSRIIERIDRDAGAAAPELKPALVFLGDYVDRGPDSKSVIDQLIALTASDRFEVRALKGNHEETLLAFLKEAGLGPTWEDFGGKQTLLSYGVASPSLRSQAVEWEKTRQAFDEALPRNHLAFLDNLELMAVYGDYAFVHAGVRPGVAVTAQREHDLLWIRDEFLQAKGPFGKVIVHGHTPSIEPFVGPFRIGIDTGAYATGVLTAVRLRDAEQTILACATELS